jgi:2-polyprenyl-3-methyl-5-hydroxy-6-metoxy-1,4-benzoquinol methylase
MALKMTDAGHAFSSYVLDPVPRSLWRDAASIDGIRLGWCETCAFYHVTPYPSERYLVNFYSKYEMPTPQANLAEAARLLSRNIAPEATIVDVGCGDGGFLKEMHALGHRRLIGFDQSPGLERAVKLGIGTFHKASVWDYLDCSDAAGVGDGDAVVMINVLEHVAEPLHLLRRIHRTLPDGGLICVTVPNDFSPLQRAFLKVKGHLPWFVRLPDHLNYFDFSSLRNALTRTGYEVMDQTSLYPLELFLLQDLDYVANPELGPEAHRRRKQFEDNMKAAGMTDVLDHFYRTLASGGYGRNVMLVARKTKASI